MTKILMSPFLRSPIIYCWNIISRTQSSYNKIGNPQSTVEHPQSTLICSKNKKKILISPLLRSPLILFVGIQFSAHRLVTKKFGTPKAPPNTPNYPYLLQKDEQNSNFAIFEIAKNLLLEYLF